MDFGCVGPREERMEHNFSASKGRLLLRPLREDDIEYLRKWRNDPEQTKYLRPIGFITPQMQKKWFEAYRINQNEITFAIEETQNLNRIVGSISIYDFAGGSAEIGKIQIGDPSAHGQSFGSISVELALYVAFLKLGLKRVTASVHRDNIASRKTFERAGFNVVGNHPSVIGGIEDIFEIDEQSFHKANPDCSEIMLCGNKMP